MTFAAVVLAAGAASRFGSDKLSAILDDEPLVHHAIRAARAAPVSRVIVVAKRGLDLGDWPGAPEVERVTIASAALSTSLKAGLAAAGDAQGIFVFLGDMPRMPHDLAGRLAAALQGGYAAVPFCEGRAGHPVLLSARSFADIAALTGDAGAGKLLKGRADVVRIECSDPGIVFDVDRPQDIDRLRSEGL